MTDSEVRYHGRDIMIRSAVAPGRQVIPHPDGGEWDYASPHVCGWDYNTPPGRNPMGRWLHDGRVLVCPGCGLDCT